MMRWQRYELSGDWFVKAAGVILQLSGGCKRVFQVPMCGSVRTPTDRYHCDKRLNRTARNKVTEAMQVMHVMHVMHVRQRMHRMHMRHVRHMIQMAL